VAHYLALIGFVLLLCVLPALHARLSAAGAQPSARRATLLSGTGIALILPTLGVELYVLPGIGRLFLEGNAAVAPLVGSIYLGGATLVMVLDLVLLAVGAIMLARDRPDPVVSDVGRDHLRGRPRPLVPAPPTCGPRRRRPSDRHWRHRTRMDALPRGVTGPIVSTTWMEHSPTSATGTGWERTPWHATQRAAGAALKKAESSP